ncbi:hypothetical protein MSLAZ_1439 [Methanosarcina lacustris Z-7289]|uniref:Uncharacterized protein n=1 Tax=Methanosarcina lacustris Z-7289 TaxID=1434111 RepID=A0A0E3WTI8_9EURY|nr:hypothetical protein MSLAZ_1439 [Methanosarcina lacustris Z-7289]
MAEAPVFACELKTSPGIKESILSARGHFFSLSSLFVARSFCWFAFYLADGWLRLIGGAGREKRRLPSLSSGIDQTVTQTPPFFV